MRLLRLTVINGAVIAVYTNDAARVGYTYLFSITFIVKNKHSNKPHTPNNNKINNIVNYCKKINKFLIFAKLGYILGRNRKCTAWHRNIPVRNIYPSQLLYLVSVLPRVGINLMKSCTIKLLSNTNSQQLWI